jgi:DNA (cytosine-5)-methyltransferase 1
MNIVFEGIDLFCGAGGSIEDPAFTLIAKMDKKPPYLITTESGDLAIEIYEGDPDIVKEIKQFMALYSIVDISIRMLMIKELLKIQGFPEGYILKGNQSDQKKFIGNAVVPVIPKKMIEALYKANFELSAKDAA